MRRVVLVRGHQANPWELRPWERLPERYAVSYLDTARSWFDTSSLGLDRVPARALRDVLPAGALFDQVVRVPGDRYLGLADRLEGADIVQAQELGYWYTAQAAALKARLGYRLVVNTWETLPFLDAYRNVRTRRYRRAVLAGADLFLPATERAARALELEGADPDKVVVCEPGVDTDRFRPSGRAPAERVILSPGRLVWEKGHQEVLRALALLRRRGAGHGARVVIPGTGPEEGRLRAHAAELGVADALELASFVPYERMPELYDRATCVVLASLPIWSWEEQFGMVIAEAHAAGVPLVTSTSGAIPEVAGPAAAAFAPGDHVGLADALAPLLAEPPVHEVRDAERVARFSVDAAAERLAAAYDRLA